MTLADLEKLDATVALLSAQLEEHDIFPLAEALREVVRAVLSDARYGFILLAMDDGQLVGLAYAASLLSAEHSGIIGWLEELYVRPEWRGRGIGSALLEATVSRAQELRWRGLELEVVAGHERAAALYLRHQFLPLDRTRYARIFTT